MTRGTRSSTTAAQASTAQLYQSLGPQLQVVRKRAGLTQADVAQAIEIATEVYGRMERGLLLPSLPTFLRLCQALDVAPEELLHPKSKGSNPSSSTGSTARATLSLARRLPDSADMRRILHRLPKASPEALRVISQMLGVLTGRR